MKRSSIGLEDIADYHCLALAFHRAAAGKALRHEVRSFRENLDDNLGQLAHDILNESLELQPMRQFQIFDPKLRLIHAPVFRERVLHHALIDHIGPVLDRSLIYDTYACRVGKGTLAAIKRVQHFSRRFSWYGQIDIKSYFANIDHEILLNLLERKFKNRGLLRLVEKIIRFQGNEGAGFPIGALTSQHFANFYLASLDRFLLETCKVRGMVRYMDDVVWWADDSVATPSVLSEVKDFLQDQLCLFVKHPTRSGPSKSGISFCGFRIQPNRLLLSKRRKSRYSETRTKWEQAYLTGETDEKGLQAGYSSVLAQTLAADALSWRKAQLHRKPLVGELADV